MVDPNDGTIRFGQGTKLEHYNSRLGPGLVGSWPELPRPFDGLK